jgi:hypothetical protein
MLSKQSRRMDEITMNDVKQFMARAWNTITFGGSAIMAGQSLLDSFHQWYNTHIEAIANSFIVKIFADLGMKFSESSSWTKFAMFAFFVFFVLTVLYIIGDRVQRKQLANKIK